MYKNFHFLFLFSNSVCPFPVPRKEILSQRDLSFDRELNNQTLKKDKTMYYVECLTCFVKNLRNFQLSQQILQKLICVSFSLFYMGVRSGNILHSKYYYPFFLNERSHFCYKFIHVYNKTTFLLLHCIAKSLMIFLLFLKGVRFQRNTLLLL